MKSHERTQALVIGGGPAGSTTASFLARDGVDVMLLERDIFPRYHIGESLLPSCLEVLELAGARQVIEEQGFKFKPGAYLDWKGEKWTLDFGEIRGRYQHSFQVPRAEFDDVLLKHAETMGARVQQGATVREIVFDGERPVSASYVVSGDDTERRVEFDYLVDCSGRSGLLANRYLKNRRFHNGFQNVAIWGYWHDVTPPSDSRDGAIIVSSIPDGWIWSIPLSEEKTSIGVVLHKDALSRDLQTKAIPEVYADSIGQSEILPLMTASARLVSELGVEQDYSYRSDAFSGPGYFLAGDSACFLDPLLSTGVHLAMYSGMLAAAGIASVSRQEVSETQVLSWYDRSYRQAFTRFLVFVSAFYEARGKAGYFTEAETLSHYDADPKDMKRAFLNLVSGLEDIADAESSASHLIGEMRRRISENLELRKDKAALPELRLTGCAAENARFFDAIEGLPILSPEMAVEGFYVTTTPRLGLAIAGSKSAVTPIMATA